MSLLFDDIKLIDGLQRLLCHFKRVDPRFAAKWISPLSEVDTIMNPGVFVCLYKPPNTKKTGNTDFQMRLKIGDENYICQKVLAVKVPINGAQQKFDNHRVVPPNDYFESQSGEWCGIVALYKRDMSTRWLCAPKHVQGIAKNVVKIEFELKDGKFKPRDKTRLDEDTDDGSTMFLPFYRSRSQMRGIYVMSTGQSLFLKTELNELITDNGIQPNSERGGPLAGPPCFA